MTTKPNLVAILGRRKPIFDDETYSRRQFGERNAVFWRRGLFSSPFLGKKRSILTTKPNLVANLGREMLFFGDETRSRHHFEEKKSPILATRPNLVAILGQKTLNFGDEAESRH
ncbi:hypothetical protein [Caldibacillus thermoamylovorans]|uniref:hypothetical protein n=1 Tax=Caldibacillus thermoamylovorans TaxID=35841 RepID=UPI0022E17EE1|nr:hypothetical protein [Caldibacillus thermoamylovorans]